MLFLRHGRRKSAWTVGPSSPLERATVKSKVSWKKHHLLTPPHSCGPLKVESLLQSSKEGQWPATQQDRHFCKCKQEQGLLTQANNSFLSWLRRSSGSGTHPSAQASPPWPTQPWAQQNRLIPQCLTHPTEQDLSLAGALPWHSDDTNQPRTVLVLPPTQPMALHWQMW